MATKKAKGKAAKRVAPKGKATATKKAPPAKAKPKAKPTKKRSVQTAAAVPPPREPSPVDTAPSTETSPEEAKRGPLARLAGGVGNLIARMTGKKAEPDETPERSPDQTIELASGDILAATTEPPP